MVNAKTLAIFLMLLTLPLSSTVFSQAEDEERQLRITAPADRAKVPERPVIRGKVLDPEIEVWLVVHPTEISEYFVQPRITVRENGDWRVRPYIGRSGTVDVGKEFEIMAVGNPEEKLREGKVLSNWPTAQCRSQVIEVIRE